MRAYEIVADGGVDALALNERRSPQPGKGEILVRVRASSINYRDLSTIEDPASRGVVYPLIPNSDGAGEVIAGWDQGVQGMKVGGRRRITIPPHLAYGSRGAGGVIGPDETLIFVVDLRRLG